MSRSRPTPELRCFAEVCADSIRHRHARLPLQCDRPGNSLFLSHSLSIFLAFSYVIASTRSSTIAIVVAVRFAKVRFSRYGAAARRAPLPEITSSRCERRALLLLRRLLRPPLSFPAPFFTLRGFPRLARSVPSRRDLPFSLILSSSLPLSSPLALSVSFSFLAATRASPSPRGGRTYLLLPTYSRCLCPPRVRADTRSPLYVKPLGDIFSRPWRKKKPNISWRQIVIGACTTGTVPLHGSISWQGKGYGGGMTMS